MQLRRRRRAAPHSARHFHPQATLSQRSTTVPSERLGKDARWIPVADAEEQLVDQLFALIMRSFASSNRLIVQLHRDF
ncbi:hypothetical protein NDU88_001357 [Pleurodeles waltl]|uniref:Uncharacterized protein n=1 Tax=Pleurodeles waltl TaxID=8319 RepID=A0AAV7SA81_PLEWA|nr:hypothetical protein NDU88_001357 [Pleurodeles waltl]